MLKMTSPNSSSLEILHICKPINTVKRVFYVYFNYSMKGTCNYGTGRESDALKMLIQEGHTDPGCM